MDLRKIGERLHDSRFRSASLAGLGALISFAEPLGIDALTHVQPWVRQFGALALLICGLMAIAGFVAGPWLRLTRS